jgi:aminoglycoside/choline kinase family phosphotransferase
MTRLEQIYAFLRPHGFGTAELAPLAQDASFRRYWRLLDGPHCAVLMDAPPAQEDTRPFLAIRAALANAGLLVPHVFAADTSLGLLLLQDLGDDLFPAVLARHPAEPLFDAATDALAVLGRAQPPDGLPNWGAAEMTAATAATFLDWWWPAMFGAPPGPPVRAAFTAAMAELLAPLQAQPAGLVHRDYWAGNLFWLPRNRAPCRVAIIDFQDAAIGAPAYDLVSLVQDARRDLPDDLADRQIARLLAARPELDRPSFEAAFAICAAQRHLRVAALWVRLARRDAKPGYLVHGPRCWRLLDRALRHPATAPLRRFLDQHVPPALRRNPDQRAA